MKTKKRNWKLLIFALLFLFVLLSGSVVYAATSSKIKFCDYGGVRRTFMIIGILINLVKIVVPLILIITAMIAFSKTILSGKTEDFKGSLMQVVKQLIAGLIIFFLPTLLDFVFDTLVTDYDPSGFTVCTYCMFEPDKCTIPDKDPEVYTGD